jgi:hypothetical protein
MVQIADRAWTLEALDSACWLARQTGAAIALVKMVSVQHPGWLGTELGYLNYSVQDRLDLAAYRDTIEDYGLSFTVHLFQYVTLVNALVQAAEQVKAQVVYATVPTSIIPYWPEFQGWLLRRNLSRQGRRLDEALLYGHRPSALTESTQPESRAGPEAQGGFQRKAGLFLRIFDRSAHHSDQLLAQERGKMRRL